VPSPTAGKRNVFSIVRISAVVPLPAIWLKALTSIVLVFAAGDLGAGGLIDGLDGLEMAVDEGRQVLEPA